MFPLHHHSPFVGWVLFILLSLSASPTFAYELAQEPQESSYSSSEESLEDLLGILESPTKRETFIKNLKGLLESKKRMEARETKGGAGNENDQLMVIRFISDKFDQISRDFRKETIVLGLMVEELPETYAGIKTFFLQTKNRPHLRILLLDVAVALLAALVFSLFLRRPVRSARSRMKFLPSKIGWGFIYFLLKALPFAALFIVFDIMFLAFPSFLKGRTFAFLLFTLMFFYKMTIAFFHVLLSPEESHTRLAPLSDENANYLWIWIRRFALYAFFYFMVTSVFLWIQEPKSYFYYLRGLLLFPFPLMLTVFVFQMARDLRLKHRAMLHVNETQPEAPSAEEKSTKKEKRVMSVVIRYWPILATGYAWAIFLSLVLKYEKGFEYLFRATLGTAVTILLVFLFLRALNLVFSRFFRINDLARQRFPGMEEKANRYLLIVKKSLRILMMVVGMGIIGEIWGIPVSAFVTSDTGGMIILRGVGILFTVAVILAIIEFANAVAAYLLKDKPAGKKKKITQKKKTLIPVIQTAINIAAGFVGTIIVLEQLGVNTTPILAGAGIIGLAVGFGSQTLVKDIISGLFILFEESIRVGDWAMVGKQGGSVESVGLRTVKLRDMNGTLHVISNSSIDSLSNFSKVFSRTVMDIGVAYREDVDQVIELLKELGEDLQKDPDHGPNILEPLEVFGLDRFEDSAVIIRARFKTKPLKQWGIKRAFYRLMKRAFDERGIEIPFPHRTLYMGEPKQGSAAPLYVNMDAPQQHPKPVQDENGGNPF